MFWHSTCVIARFLGVVVILLLIVRSLRFAFVVGVLVMSALCLFACWIPSGWVGLGRLDGFVWWIDCRCISW